MIRSFFSSKKSDYSQETLDIIRLIRSENVGTRTFYALVQMYGSASEALENIGELSVRGGRKKPIHVCSEKEIKTELAKLESFGAKALTYLDSDYPALLKHIPDAPPVINYLGNKELFNTKTCAIVGARNASLNGKNFTTTLAKNISEHGITIASGLARGIDAAAHEAAMPLTIGVIAGGIDHIYPPENAKLYEKMAKEGGAIIAENRIGSAPLAQHFPQRNRIISGLSLVTLVIEAGFKSGSLITARMALEQGREVCAVPGFPLDPRCEGTNRLIKDGAYLIESYHDVLEHFKSEHRLLPLKENESEFSFAEEATSLDTKSRNILLENLSATPTNIEQLHRHTDLPLPIIYTILLEFELAGLVVRHPGNKFSRVY